MTELKWSPDLAFKDIPDEDEFRLDVTLRDMDEGKCDHYSGDLRIPNGALEDFISDVTNCGFFIGAMTSGVNGDKTGIKISYTFKFK